MTEIKRPKISCVIPFHFMSNWQFFLNRCLTSIQNQSFKDYEVVLIKHSTMPVTSNRTIESAKGEIIKVLYLDDYLSHAYALQEIVDAFKGGWLVTGCTHDDGSGPKNYHAPSFDGILKGENTIGSPSVLAFENYHPLLFDEQMTWLLDVDLYARLNASLGPPTILDTPNVTIGLGPHQVTNLLADDVKIEEAEYLQRKYDKRK